MPAYVFQMPSPLSVTSESQLPGNRKDAKTVPKGKGRQSATVTSDTSTSGDAGKSSSARSAEPYDSDQEELRDDPLYAPPGKI